MSNSHDNSGVILPVSSEDLTNIKGGDFQTFSTPGLFASGFGDEVDIQSGEGFVSVTSSSSSSNSDSQTSSNSKSTSYSSSNFSFFS